MDAIKEVPKEVVPKEILHRITVENTTTGRKIGVVFTTLETDFAYVYRSKLDAALDALKTHERQRENGTVVMDTDVKFQ